MRTMKMRANCVKVYYLKKLSSKNELNPDSQLED